MMFQASTGVGHDMAEDHRSDAARRQHPGGVEREDVALAAGVVADDHAALRRVGIAPVSSR